MHASTLLALVVLLATGSANAQFTTASGTSTTVCVNGVCTSTATRTSTIMATPVAGGGGTAQGTGPIDACFVALGIQDCVPPSSLNMYALSASEFSAKLVTWCTPECKSKVGALTANSRKGVPACASSPSASLALGMAAPQQAGLCATDSASSTAAYCLPKIIDAAKTANIKLNQDPLPIAGWPTDVLCSPCADEYVKATTNTATAFNQTAKDLDMKVNSVSVYVWNKDQRAAACAGKTTAGVAAAAKTPSGAMARGVSGTVVAVAGLVAVLSAML